MFTASGLIVRFLKVFEKGDYPSVKWVRYLTKASGSYQVRVSQLPAQTSLFCVKYLPVLIVCFTEIFFVSGCCCILYIYVDYCRFNVQLVCVEDIESMILKIGSKVSCSV